MAANLGTGTITALLAGRPKAIHFIGIGGSGMYPLVQVLLAAGHRISGSDVNEGDIIERERRAGIPVSIGHQAQNVQGAQLVVYSAAIPPSNPERQAAEQLGIPCIERSTLLGYVSTLYRRPLCIAGTHGKTTATGMAVQILEMANLHPGAIIGGRLPLIDGYGQPGANNDVIAIEACEYHNTFLELSVDTAVLLNVDNDHLEFFGSMDNLQAAFRSFCATASSAVLYNGDDENTLQALEPLLNSASSSPTPAFTTSSIPILSTLPTSPPATSSTSTPIPSPASLAGAPAFLSFGFSSHCHWQATNAYQHKPAYWAFTLLQGGASLGEIRLGAPGRHNIYNALAACTAALRLGASFAQCAVGLAAFAGTGRRFQVLGQVHGFTVADDYAHHPTELEAVLSTAQQMGYKKVWAVFQPYTYSRTQMLLADFARALPIANRVVMTDIMGGRERAEDYHITTAALAEKIPGSTWLHTQRQAADYILKNAEAGDLILTLGCGDIYKCAHMLLEG